mmetsp:Transcript_19201/g.24422  ORF Transcript_19201/g.24422 Transcript_19201/m.24422 type:complete len:652 (+) Transcript_19201:80-2035(+)
MGSLLLRILLLCVYIYKDTLTEAYTDDDTAGITSWRQIGKVYSDALSVVQALKLEQTTLYLKSSETFKDIAAVERGPDEEESDIDSALNFNLQVPESDTSAVSKGSKGSFIESKSKLERVAEGSEQNCETSFAAQVGFEKDETIRYYVDASTRQKSPKAYWVELLSSRHNWELVDSHESADIIIIAKTGNFFTWPKDKHESYVKLVSVLSTEAITKGTPRFLLTAQRQVQLELGNQYMNNFQCTWDSLGIRPPSYDVTGDIAQCRAMFSLHRDINEADIPWFIKPYCELVCQKHLINENEKYVECMDKCDRVHILRGIASLRNRYAKCNPKDLKSERPVILERVVENPLLVHNRRIKLHSYVLVCSTVPWIILLHPGLVTLASIDIRTDTTASYSGSAAPDVKTLQRETTNPFRQNRAHVSNQASANDRSVWNFPRLLRHLVINGHCDSDVQCSDLMVSKMVHIAKIVTDSSVRQWNRSKGRFQMFEVSFWLTENMGLFWDHGTEDLSLIYYSYALSMQRVVGNKKSELNEYSIKIWGDAIDMVKLVQSNPPSSRNLTGLYPDWKLVRHEMLEIKCKKTEFNPCEHMDPGLQVWETKGHEDSLTQSEKAGTDDGDKDRNTNINLKEDGMALPSDSIMASPTIKLNMNRRPV